MEKRDMLYEGKAKKIFTTNDTDKVIIYFKDDATAFNNQKKGTITGKGAVNNAITASVFTTLEKNGIKTHFIEKLNDKEQLCKKVSIIPLEFIVRNIVAGSMAKRLGIAEGTEIEEPIFEICYKDDDLGDPLINDNHAVAMKLTTYDDLAYMYKKTSEINDLLKSIFKNEGILLVDFKIEYGKHNSEILLADEITPDTCRLWDIETKQKLDKDRFRKDLGGVEQAYLEILSRLTHSS